jgi:predicted RNA-binding protein with PUA-like domain
VNVDIRLRGKTCLLGLAEMRSRPELATMEVLRPGSRLSITPVTEIEWAAVMQLLNRP